jgi:hypothetical protein
MASRGAPRSRSTGSRSRIRLRSRLLGLVLESCPINLGDPLKPLRRHDRWLSLCAPQLTSIDPGNYHNSPTFHSKRKRLLWRTTFTVTTVLFRRPPIIIRDQPRLPRAVLPGVALHQVVPFALSFKNQVCYLANSPMAARTFFLCAAVNWKWSILDK